MYKIFDLHNDYLLKLNSNNKKLNYLSKQKCAESIISAVWTSKFNEEESFSFIRSAAEFVNGQKMLQLGVEDLHFLRNTNLDEFLKIRPIYAGLTWNNSNSLAGGASEGGNLTAFGKTVISRLEKSNIRVDLAHLNEDSFCDVFKIASKPPFCSHTAFYGVNQNLRNLKDYQIKMIIDSGGIIGLCLVSDFISGTKKCAMTDIVSHIDYFACKFGIDNLAIGTDFFGTEHLPKGIRNYNNLTSAVSAELEKLGYTQKAISKIFYDNANMYFEKCI